MGCELERESLGRVTTQKQGLNNGDNGENWLAMGPVEVEKETERDWSG